MDDLIFSYALGVILAYAWFRQLSPQHRQEWFQAWLAGVGCFAILLLILAWAGGMAWQGLAVVEGCVWLAVGVRGYQKLREGT